MANVHILPTKHSRIASAWTLRTQLLARLAREKRTETEIEARYRAELETIIEMWAPRSKADREAQNAYAWDVIRNLKRGYAEGDTFKYISRPQTVECAGHFLCRTDAWAFATA